MTFSFAIVSKFFSALSHSRSQKFTISCKSFFPFLGWIYPKANVMLTNFGNFPFSNDETLVMRKSFRLSGQLHEVFRSHFCRRLLWEPPLTFPAIKWLFAAELLHLKWKILTDFSQPCTPNTRVSPHRVVSFCHWENFCEFKLLCYVPSAHQNRTASLCIKAVYELFEHFQILSEEKHLV